MPSYRPQTIDSFASLTNERFRVSMALAFFCGLLLSLVLAYAFGLLPSFVREASASTSHATAKAPSPRRVSRGTARDQYAQRAHDELVRPARRKARAKVATADPGMPEASALLETALAP
jgi:hypothetical protein